MGMEVNFQKHMNTDQRRFLVLVSASAIKFCCGEIYAQAVYAQYIKSVFHMNQKELDTSLSILPVGSALMLLAGFFYDYFGSRKSVLLSGILSTILQCLTLAALMHPSIIGSRVWVLCILFFLYGHSFIYSYVAAIGTCMCSFPVNKRAMIMAIIDTAFVCTIPITAFLYFLIMGYQNAEPADQSPLGIFLFLIVINVFSHIFAFLFMVPVEMGYSSVGDEVLAEHCSGSVELSEQTPILANDSKNSNNDSDDEDKVYSVHDTTKEPTTCCDFLKQFVQHFSSAKFWPFFVAIICLIAVLFSIAVNVTTISRSLQLQEHNLQFLLIPPCFGIAARFFLASVSDNYFSLAYQRILLLFILTISFGTLSLLLLCVPISSSISPFAVLLSGLIFSHIVVAAVYTLTPVFLSQIFGSHIFGQLYSVINVAGVLSGLWLSIAFGAIYDNEAKNSHEPTDASACLGHRCYIYGNLIAFFVHFIGVGFLFGYAMYIRKNSQQR